MDVQRWSWGSTLLAAALGALACSDGGPRAGTATAAAGGAGSAGITSGAGTGGIAGSAQGGAGAAAAGAPAGGVGGAGAGGATAPALDAAVQPDATVADADVAADGSDAGAMAACDRSCLLAIMSSYLDALVANDSSRLPVTATVRFTENGVEQQLGAGFWQSATAIRMDTRQDFADPQEGQVGSQLVAEESGGAPVIYQVRLKVVARAISEIEPMVVHRVGARNGFFDPEGMVPDSSFDQPVEPALRVSREQLKTIVDKYFDALDGGPWAEGLFDASVARFENGVRTATATSITRQSWNFDVVRRYLVFDEEFQMVWGMFAFTPADNALVVGELFKVTAGKIGMIQAVMAEIPAKAWE